VALALFPTRAARRTREKASPYVLAFSADDFTLLLPTGQTLTYTRTGTKTVQDSSGRVTTLGKNQPSWAAAYNATTGNYEPVYQSDRAVTNLVLRSEDFGTTWSAVGSPTRTAAAKSAGDVALDLLGDDAAGTLEGYTQTVTFTGNAQKAVSLFIAKGTSTSSVIRLRDTTASANRLLATVTWSGTVPSVAMTTGTHLSLSPVPCGNGVYRLLFQTSSVTAANTNQLEIYPATDSGLSATPIGNVYVGGVQAENYEAPRQYAKSVSSAATTTGDELSTPISWLPQDFTVYARLARPPWVGATMLSGFVGGIVSQWNTTGNRWGVRYEGASGNIVAYLHDGGTSASASVAVPSTGFFDLCVQYTDVATGGKCRVDVGAGFGSYSSSVNAISSWAVSTLYVGQWASGTENMDAGIRKLIIAPGAHTLSALRGIVD
jgi:hypothetical protein